MQKQTLKSLGEFGLIENIKEKFAELLPQNFFGIGDDCAVIPIDEKYSYIMTTDMLIEDVHFLRSEIPLEDLVWKSMAVNLSDIAAMGGKPVAFLSSIAIPNDVPAETLIKANEHLFDIAKKYNIPNIGGDTTSSKKHIAISISILGKMENSKIKYRHTAKIDDIVCVTGNLGDSGAGLDSIINNRKDSHLIKRHHHPYPRIKEGLFLAEYEDVHAMMDISDGIASDLKRIKQASNVGIEIDIDKIPISEELSIYCKKFNLPHYHFSAQGGEDYELLLTVSPEKFEQINSKYIEQFSKPIYPIGKIVKENHLRFAKNNLEIKINEFRHFS
jgi:thiamine-monophosphate kinase